MKRLLMLLLLVPLFTVSAQDEEDVTNVAIRLRRTGTLEEANYLVLRDSLTTEITNLDAFNVVEAEDLQEVRKEVNLSMQDVTSTTLAADQMAAADMVMVGSIGKLYDKIVIVTRVVDTETREILFSNTLYSDEENITDDIKTLAEDIADKRNLLTQESSPEMVREEFKRKNYAKTLDLIKILKKDGIGDQAIQQEMEELQEDAEIRLSKELYKESRDKYRKGRRGRLSLRINYIRDSLKLINQAVLLSPEENYFLFREKVLERKEEVELSIEQEQQKEEDQNERLLARQEAGITSGWDAIRLYYKNIDPDGLHLGYSLGGSIGEDLSPGGFQNNWYGGDLFITHSYKDRNDILYKQWSAGLHGRYEKLDDGNYQMVAQVTVSPFLSRSLKITNLFLTWGFDGGGIIKISPSYLEGYAGGLTLGGTAGAEFKFYKSMALFVQGRLDYEFYLNEENLNGWQPRISAGLVF